MYFGHFSELCELLPLAKIFTARVKSVYLVLAWIGYEHGEILFICLLGVINLRKCLFTIVSYSCFIKDTNFNDTTLQLHY